MLDGEIAINTADKDVFFSTGSEVVHLNHLKNAKEDVDHRTVSDAQITDWTAKQEALGFTPVNVAGDAMQGNLVMPNGTKITLNDAPVLPTDVVNKNYVDNAATGLVWKNDAVAATTGPVGSSSQLNVSGIGANDDVTYSAKTVGPAGDSIRVEHVLGSVGAQPVVSVAGNDITVALGLSAGDQAAVTVGGGAPNDGVIYTAAAEGIAGNSIRVAHNGSTQGQALAVNVSGNDITVTLETSTDVAADLVIGNDATNEAVVYVADVAGVEGNSIRVAHIADAPDQTLAVSVAGSDVTVTLATDAGDAAHLDIGVGNSAVSYAANTEGVTGNSIRVTQIAAAPNQVLDVAVTGNDIAVTLATTDNTAASLTLGGVAENDGVTYTAVNGGLAGNSIRIEHAVPAPETALSISVNGNDITVTLATDVAGDVTSTALDVANAVEADPTASLLVNAIYEGTGADIAVAAGFTNLSGGANFTVSSTAQAVADAVNLDEDASTLVTASAGGDGTGTAAVAAFTNLGNGGENFLITSTAGAVAIAVNAHGAAAALLNASATGDGQGYVLAQSMSNLSGGAVFAIVSTAQEVADAVNAATALVDATVEGDGSGVAVAQAFINLTGGAEEDIASTAAQVRDAVNAHVGASSLVTASAEGNGAGVTKVYAMTALSGGKTLNGGAPKVVDGVTLQVADRVLVKDAVTPSENGLYTVNVLGTGSNGTWVRTEDADAIEELAKAAIYVRNGTTNGSKAFTCTAKTTDVLGTTPVTFVQFNGAQTITAGIGLVTVGNQFDVNLGAGIAQLPTDEVGIDVRATGGLFLTENGSTSSTGTNAQLAVKLDGTSLAVGANGLKVGSAGVSEVELATSVAGNGLSGGAGAALAVVGDAGISVSATGVALDTAFTDARYINIDGDTLTGPLVLAADPEADLEAAPKQYVDAAKAAAQQAATTAAGTYTDQKVAAIPYDLASSFSGKPAQNDEVVRIVMARACKFAVGMGDSISKSRVAAAAGVQISLRKNGVEFGTLIFSAASDTGGFTAEAETTFARGDIFSAVVTGTTDTAFEDVAFTFAASLV
jgi:hypothetical protein